MANGYEGVEGEVQSRIAEQGDAAGGALAFTGMDVTILIVVGLALIAVGLVMYYLTSNKKTV